MNTVIGILATDDGIARDPGQRRSRWATPASEIRAVQAPWIPVDRDHSGDWLGQVIHLERRHGNLWCVAEVDTEPTIRVRVGDDVVDLPEPFFFSVERTPFDEDILIRSVALTSRPARLGAHPVTWFRGGLAHRSGWHVDWQLRPLIARAGESRYTRHGGPLMIRDAKPPGAGLTRLARSSGYTGGYLDENGEHIPTTRGGPVGYDEEGRPHTLMVRPCGSILSVR
jgi:hypothetical protein